MNDDALFCSKCGTKVSEPDFSNSTEPVNQAPQANEAPNETPAQNKPIKQKYALHEQKIREFLPVSLAIIVASIILWIIDSTLHPTGIGHTLPFLNFLLFTGVYSPLQMVRAIKTLNRKMYFKSILSFVLFGLLVTCFIIDFILLFNNA